MSKTTEYIKIDADSNDDDYLQRLLMNLKKAYANQERLTFRIVEAKAKGFTVKVGGLFAYVSFKQLSWSYPSLDYWHNVSNYLVGNYFRGTIYKFEENPISIHIDATQQTFEYPKLMEGARYRGVILQKTKYGVFVDIGVHFKWKFGSILGLIHKSTLVKESDYDHWREGKVIVVRFQGFNKDGHPQLRDNRDRGKWCNGETDQLIGTIQNVSVVIGKEGQPEFYVLGKHKAIIPVRREIYPNSISRLKEFVYNLKDGEEINCEVLGINKRKDSFILKLLLEPTDN
ncbi:S1 RNA-binding domain-containing protein [Arenibacter latericius]|uniref:S1 RNA-binding domain-containing protein n=1 Tax=Arenibacter latericius TaxID=86104 RepID=UPI00047A711F|nr:S1 RNA-binding domain-containing protein [Arenibacter latericius]